MPAAMYFFVLVPDKKYSKIGVLSLYGRSDYCRGFPVYIFNPCFRVLYFLTSMEPHTKI